MVGFNQSVFYQGNLTFDAIPSDLAAPASFHPESDQPGASSIHIITSHTTQTLKKQNKRIQKPEKENEVLLEKVGE